MNKTCFIFFYEGWVGVHPTVISLTKVLSKRGYGLNIYGTENSYPKPNGSLGARTQIFWFRKNFKLLNDLKKSNHKFLSKFKGLIPVSQSVIFTIQCLKKYFCYDGTSPQKGINIGIDIYGTVSAFLISLIKRQKYLFLSLELKNEPNNYKGTASIFASLAKLAYRRAECVIVQDEDRFETLCRQFEYRHPKVFYLPNSSLPSEELDKIETNYFREKFKLKTKDFPCVLLMAGMINDTCHAKTLAKSFLSIDKCALVFHERHKRSLSDPYIQSLQQINSKNLFLSLEPLPYEQVDRVYASAEIGLAFYQAIAGTGDNFTKISKASGKLNHYLKLGKPILVNDLPSLKNLVEKYECGIVIKDLTNPQEIESAIDKILSDYERYSQNAKRCFDIEFDFIEKFQPILSFMEQRSGVTVRNPKVQALLADRLSL